MLCVDTSRRGEPVGCALQRALLPHYCTPPFSGLLRHPEWWPHAEWRRAIRVQAARVVVILKFAINQGKLFAPPGARVGGMGAFSAQACV